MIKQKSKFRFNFIDVLLIVLIVLIIGIAYYFLSGKNNAINKSKSLDLNDGSVVQYVVELNEIDKDFIKYINVGDVVFDTYTETNIGEIVNVTVAPAWKTTTNLETGETKKTEYPVLNPDAESEADFMYDYYNVRVTIQADMEYTGSSYAVNDYSVVVGSLIDFQLNDFAGQGYCISFDVIN